MGQYSKDLELVELCLKKDVVSIEKILFLANRCIEKIIGCMKDNLEIDDFTKEDLVQEFIYKICADDFNILKKYSAKSSLETWLINVAKNFLLDYRRKQMRYSKKYKTESDFVERKSDDEDFHSEDINSYSSRDIEDEFLDSKIDCEEILSLLNDVLERRCIELKLLNNCSQKEIAKILDMDQGTVGSKISRGIKKLKKCFKQKNVYEKYEF
ncbi:MAG: sigma-70 family RNA polymerase sigma factor [Endomicrobiia bacterium]